MRAYLLCLQLFFIACFSQAQHLAENQFKIEPLGLSYHDGAIHFLSGMSDAYMEYKEIRVDKKIPKELDSYHNFDFVKVLNSGLNSFLFEYKHYHGDISSAYSIFALGNYTVITDKVLAIANKMFFPNRKLLKVIYDWSLPEYKKAFQLMTYEEQAHYLDKIDFVESYVQFVLIQKNENAYQNWLMKNKKKDDFRLCGFLNRRVKKGQWKIQDCKYWIDRVRKDFSPLLKNKTQGLNHYQIVEALNENCMMAMNHEGYFTVIQEDATDLTFEKYTHMKKIDEHRVVAGVEFSLKYRDTLDLRDIPLHGCFIHRVSNFEPNYTVFEDSICLYTDHEWIQSYETDEKIYLYKLYDFKNKKVIEDRIKFIFYDNSGNYIYLVREDDVIQMYNYKAELVAPKISGFYSSEWLKIFGSFNEISDRGQVIGYYFKETTKTYLINTDFKTVQMIDASVDIDLCNEDDRKLCFVYEKGSVSMQLERNILHKMK